MLWRCYAFVGLPVDSFVCFPVVAVPVELEDAGLAWSNWSSRSALRTLLYATIHASKKEQGGIKTRKALSLQLKSKINTRMVLKTASCVKYATSPCIFNKILAEYDSTPNLSITC